MLWFNEWPILKAKIIRKKHFKCPKTTKNNIIHSFNKQNTQKKNTRTNFEINSILKSF